MSLGDLPPLQPQVLDRVVCGSVALPVDGLGVGAEFQQLRKGHRVAQGRDVKRGATGSARFVHIRPGLDEEFQHPGVRVGRSGPVERSCVGLVFARARRSVDSSPAECSGDLFHGLPARHFDPRHRFDVELAPVAAPDAVVGEPQRREALGEDDAPNRSVRADAKPLGPVP